MELSGYRNVSGSDGLDRYGFIYPPSRRPTTREGEREGPLVACGECAMKYRLSTENTHTIIARTCADILHIDFQSQVECSTVDNVCLCLDSTLQVFPIYLGCCHRAALTWCLLD